MKNRITELCEARGLSFRTLAKKLGTSPSQISRLAKDKRGLSIEWLLRISGALDVPPGELIDADLGSLGPAKCDQALMGTVIAFVFQSCEKFDVKPLPKEMAGWISFVYDHAARNHATFAQIKELASTIVKVGKKGSVSEPFMDAEDEPKSARKRIKTTKAA